jgi:hypothetical protein
VKNFPSHPLQSYRRHAIQLGYSIGAYWCGLSKYKAKPIGPYTGDERLYRLDGQSRAARFLKDYRYELIQHLGHPPSVTERAVIDRASMIALKCALLDAKILAGADTELDSRQILAWSGALTRLLHKHLGLKAPVVEPRSLASVLRGDAA